MTERIVGAGFEFLLFRLKPAALPESEHPSKESDLFRSHVNAGRTQDRAAWLARGASPLQDIRLRNVR